MTTSEEIRDTGDFAELGHPIHLFIDTSVLERMQFPFGLPPLKALMTRLDAGDIKVVIPEVVGREIREHVSASVDKAKNAHAKFRRDASITKIITDPGVASVITDVDWNVVRTAVVATVEQFLDSPGVEILPIDGDDAADVFDDYFARRAPFGEGKKKSEFPDSFAMKALLRYAKDNGCKIAVMSLDKDWHNACEINDNLIRCSSLDQIVEHSQIAEAVLHDEIRTMLEPHRAELEAAVIESFRDRGFYWESDEGHDSEVEETYDEKVESWPWSVLAVEDGWVEIAGDASVHFKATAIYPDPDSGFRDPDTKEHIFFGYVHATLLSTILVQVNVCVNLDALKDKKLEYEELIVNTHGDVWFSEYAIENLRTDSDSFHE